MIEDDSIPLLTVRLTLYQLLHASYAAPIGQDLAEALGEVAATYNRLVDREIPPLQPPSPQGESPEFHRLFVGPDRLVAPPYASVYTSPDRVLMQEETLAVRTFYQSCGLRIHPDLREPDDHIATELEFYARLQELTRRAIAEARWAEARHLAETQHRFWKAHLWPWVPAFCREVVQGAKSPCYRSLAKITWEVLTAEKQILPALEAYLATKEESVHEQPV